MESNEGLLLQSLLSIRFSFLFLNPGDTACRGLLPEVCKCVNTVAVEMSRRSVCARTPFLPTRPPSLAFTLCLGLI